MLTNNTNKFIKIFELSAKCTAFPFRSLNHICSCLLADFTLYFIYSFSLSADHIFLSLNGKAIARPTARVVRMAIACQHLSVIISFFVDFSFMIQSNLYIYT